MNYKGNSEKVASLPPNLSVSDHGTGLNFEHWSPALQIVLISITGGTTGRTAWKIGAQRV